MSDMNKNIDSIIRCLGGKENISAVTNCMTRLRIVVRNDDVVDTQAMQNLPDVLGTVHDRPLSYEIVVGPGKSRKYADACHEMGLPAAEETADDSQDWKANKAAFKQGQKNGRVKTMLKSVGDIFVPLIPGVIAAGLCAGFASLLEQLVPNYANIPVWSLLYNILSLINASFMTYITAWAGYRAAERFGATPILGGMLGMITSLDGVNTIAKIVGLYNEATPLDSILRVGKGGVLAVIIGVLLLSFVEKKIRKHMPNSVDIVLTPLITLIVCAIPYIFVIMPLFGFVSSGIAWAFGKACMSNSIIVRAIVGFIASALFLPMVATGMHHGMVALYTVQLQQLGYVTLYPALAMAGAGQVGAAIAIYQKAKKAGNARMCSVISGALPAGFLGVGEPLIYGVTLPLGKPFFFAGLGAGFGGAFVMMMQVASTTWGPSGLIGVFVMTGGPGGAVKSMICYLIGLGISYVCSYIITKVFYRGDELCVSPPASETAAPPESKDAIPSDAIAPSAPAGTRIAHGDRIPCPGLSCSFEHVIHDQLGIHARPAAELVKLSRKFSSRITIEANGRTASAGNLLELMKLGAAQNTVLKVTAVGADAPSAVQSIHEFLSKSL